MYSQMIGCMKTHKFFAILTLLIASTGQVSAGVIALYEFNSSTGYTESSFDAPAFDSSDTDALTTASRLGNSRLTGGTTGDYLPSGSKFSTSDSGPRGLKVGGAHSTTPERYVYFTVTPNAASSVTYSSLSYFNQTAVQGKIQLSVIDGGGSEQVLDDFTITTIDLNVTKRVIDFTDFSTSSVTEWRLYMYNSGDAQNSIRLDDITLNGTTAAVPEPSTAIAMFLLGALGFAGQRRRRHQS